MPQDLFQIALEHHRGGRVRQAESGYRAALQADPHNPDALHWLGVLTLQAGDIAAATPLLERAAALRPKDAAFQHNVAQAYLQSRRFDEAVRAFERASTLDSNQPQTLLGLAIAHASRPEDGNQTSIFYLKQAQLAGLDSAELHLYLGIALLKAQRTDEAIESLRAALHRKTDCIPAYYHLSAAYHQKGDTTQARHWVAATLQLDPQHAVAWQALAVMEAEAGRLDEAEALFRGAISVRPDFTAAYQALAQLLRTRGKEEEARAVLEQAAAPAKSQSPNAIAPTDAIAAFEQRLTMTQEAENGRFALAARHGFAPPPQLPHDSVVDLFDRYADRFDEHLRGKLEYRVPELIAETIAATKPDRPLDVLDLGCGTGLCGMLLKPMAGLIWGVDLSPVMLSKSNARGVYDYLELGDVVAVMNAMTQTFDLITGGDMLIYIGDLTPFFEAAVRRLRPGGRIIVSVEAGSGDRYEMGKKSLRYMHSHSYIQRLATMFGLKEESFAPITVRIEARVPVAGNLVTLLLPSEND
jgi:predicted TPR repeat methyltransferase